ncbi:MAG: dihydroorotate dehydrogenase (quinone) [Rickettsiales bacterium]|nr:dihydroorotate dehydrogenase (quinone) [Rickettsiales bacterium]
MIFRTLSKFTGLISPELLHSFFLATLKLNLFNKKKNYENLKLNLLGRDFDNPLGLAAGFDKNAQVLNGSFGLGFGFLEVGTVTPMPQKGNSKPRVFKIPEYEAVIQRLGFNNDGIEVFLRNLKKFRLRYDGLVGANIGKNKSSSDLFSDYKFLYQQVEPFADYITINISSPNTPGLRDLQQKDKFKILIKEISKLKKKPTFIKISPDISSKEIKDICDLALNEDLIDGLVLTNTTISRNSLFSKPLKNHWKIEEDGGLSGPPLRKISNEIIKKVYKETKGKIILIGVGGISNGKDAFEKISLGCSLVQLYTSLVYKGPNIVAEILAELSQLIQQKGLKNIKELIGANIKL